jgi:DNA primase
MADYSKIAESTFQIGLRSGDEWMCRCLWHDDSSASLQFNIRKGVYVCFGCGEKGNIKSLMRYLGRRFDDIEADITDITAKLDALDKQAGKPERLKVLPESILKRYDFPTDYWSKRGFTDATIKAFDLGYDPIEDEATIPVRTLDGELIGTIKRRLGNDSGPRYMYPKGFPRKLSLFGSWLVAKTITDEVAITEGAVDTMTLWQLGVPSVAQYGSAISREQVALLRRLGISRLTFFYDNDKAGDKALEVALPLTRDFLIKVVEYKKGDPKDPNGFDSESLRNRIEFARLVM